MIFPYMWNLKYYMNELFFFLKQSRNRLTRIENKFMVTKGKGSWEEKIGSVGLTYTHYYIYIYRRRQWHPTPGLLPGKSHGRRSLVGAVHGVSKSRTRLSDFTFTFHFHALEKEMATHSSVLAWRIPGTGEHDGLPSMGLHRVRHD